MVDGLDRFQAHFADYADRYVLIGGTASSLAIDEVGGGPFRSTKDLDIVLCIEALDRKFVEVFWDFVKQGGYETRQKSTGKRLFYRFYTPVDKSYPYMLELFARVPDALDLKADVGLTPIPVDEAVSSLSAILMDDDYYGLVMDRRRDVNGLSIIGADILIPLKAQAYMDLTNRKAAGERIDSKNINKHKNDIFRLFTVLDRNVECPLPVRIQGDLTAALTRLSQEVVDLKSLGLRRITLSEVLTSLSRFYGLNILYTAAHHDL
ncbi:MAG: hypothetical protein ACSHYA_01410 [Opitutaceae bacterium]